MNLYQAIRYLGGIRHYRDNHLREEMRVIPLCLRRRQGMPLDEMRESLASLGFWFETESDLLDAIARHKGSLDEKAEPQPSREFPTLQDVQLAHMQRALELCGGNQRQAARLLDVPYVSFQRYVKRYQLTTALSGVAF